MAKDKYTTKYVLLESNSFDSILSPLKATQRIKYTCFDVSQNFIIFGATSGGLYIFSREPCHFLQLLPNKDGSLTNVSISPDEKFIGFSTSRGIAVILKRSDEGGAFFISRSEEHCGTTITSLTWCDNSNQLYIADDSGQLSVINISLFINNSIFQLPSHVIIKLDSEIFQVSCCGELLLVSTRTRCYICDTVKEQYKQIGTKLREGVFGASFIKYSDDIIKAFCARPGSRLWEVDTNGSVLCTHQFKEALSLNPSVTVSLPDYKVYKSEFPQWQEQAVNFPYLFPVLDTFLFTFKQDSFFIFDPEKVELIIQCNQYSNVVDARCITNTIYTWNSEGSLQEFALIPVENCLINLYFRGAYSLCVELCEHYSGYIEALEYNRLILMSPLLGLSEHIDNLHLNNKLSSFFVNLNNCCNIQTFKLNLNDSLESNFKVPKVCDKASTLFSNDKSISQTSALVINSSCLCHYKNIDCSHEDFSENKKNNIISYLDNNIKINEFLVDNNLSSYISNESSPDTSLSLPSQDFYSSFNNKIINEKSEVSVDAFFRKWELCEDKFDSTKETFKKNCDNHYFDHKDLASVNLSDSDDSIVLGRESKEENFLGIPAIDYSPLIDICDMLTKSDNSCKVELFAQFLKGLFLLYNEYKNSLLIENKMPDLKSFPLNKCLPDNCIKAISECFCDIVNSGNLTDCLKLLPEEYSKSTLLPVKYPNLLLNMHSYNDLESDISLSNVIFMIIDILDPYIILNLIDNSNLPCSFISWYTVLQSFQDNTFDYITFPQDSYKFNDWPLPVVLNILFLMLRLDQVESACYISKEIHINIKHILYLILRLQLQLEASGIVEEESSMQCNKLFLKYVANLVEHNSNLFKDLCCESVKFIENAVVAVSNMKSCHICNFPVVGIKFESSFDNVGELLLQYYADKELFTKVNDTDKNELNHISLQDSDFTSLIADDSYFDLKQLNLYKCLTKFVNEKYVSKIFDLVKVMPRIIIKLIKLNCCEIKETIDLIAQFNLINQVELLTSSFSTENWVALCECFKEMSQGFCCICHHSSKNTTEDVQWNSLATSMLQSLGPGTTIKILKNYSSFITPGQLGLSFYRTALLSDILEVHPFEEPSYKDLMSTYHGQFIKEPIDSHLSQLGVVSMWEAESSDDSTEGLTPNVVHSKDRKHWGITLDVNSDVCSKCSLILNSEKLLKDGIRSFKCGHTYHVLCLRLSNSLFKCSICS